MKRNITGEKTEKKKKQLGNTNTTKKHVKVTRV